MKKNVRIRTAYSVKFISTGCDVLDCALGGGWARGRVANIVGDRSSGKTLLAIEGAIKALLEAVFNRADKKQTVRIVYDAAEGAMDFDLEKMYHVRGLRQLIEWKYSDTVEQFDANVADVCANLAEDELLVYILDSLDSLTDEKEQAFDKKRQRQTQKEESGDEEEDGKKKKGTYGTDKARLMNRFFRRNCLSMAKNDVLLIVVSQTRSNMAMLCGCIVIGTNAKLSGMQEYLMQRKTGFIVSHWSQAVNVIKSLVSQKDSVKEVRTNAITKIHSLGDRQENMRRFAKLLTKGKRSTDVSRNILALRRRGRTIANFAYR